MKYTIQTFSLIPILFFFYTPKETKYYYSVQEATNKTITDTIESNFTILPITSAKLFSKNENPKSILLTSENLLLIDNILKTFLNEYNKKGDSINIDRYYRQYVPYVLNNDSTVFINCFSKGLINEFPHWRKYFVAVDGGGKAFFCVKVNLKERKCFEFWVNTPL